MDEHFLKDFVKDQPRESPLPWYNSHGDCIVYQMQDEAAVAERIDGVLTIYRSATTGRSIGYQIKGVAALTRAFGWEGILVRSKQDDEQLKEISLSALLLAAYEQGPKTISRRKGYAGAFESVASNPRMQTAEFDCLLHDASILESNAGKDF
jgi:hypothetical protein